MGTCFWIFFEQFWEFLFFFVEKLGGVMFSVFDCSFVLSMFLKFYFIFDTFFLFVPIFP